MIFPSVDNFFRIYNFYRLNSIRDIKNLNKQQFRYNTADKYFDSLNYDYGDGVDGLTYPVDKDAINISISARNDLAKYFNEALFPGSHSFNTQENYVFKQILLDWASVIKTFQDSAGRCSDVYSLTSDDVDKAIRGFGIDFVNSRTVRSLNKRQTFLLELCNLYKIKGSPQSIIRALNIIGLEDIYITEAWVYPTRDGHKNVEIKWIPVKEPQKFDNITNSYYTGDEQEPEYWEWGSFKSRLATINECHWFYNKSEIIHLNWEDPETFFYLPSITPYFNVKIKFDACSNEMLLHELYNKATEEIGKYLTGNETSKNIYLDVIGCSVDFLSLYCGFIYTLIQYSDCLRYNQLKKFLDKYGINGIDYDKIGQTNRYIELIYQLFNLINSMGNERYRTLYQSLVDTFVLSAVPLNYCSYNEVLNWWINRPHESIDDKNGLTSIKQYVYPTHCNLTSVDGYVEIFWNEDYNYGYYDLELFINGQWVVKESNSKVCSERMQRIIPIYIYENDVHYSDMDDLRTKIRIVHYHTQNNIPSIFFGKPFYFDQVQKDTEMDMIYTFNENLIIDSIYKNEALYNLFIEQNCNIENKFAKKDILENYYDYYNNQDVSTVDKLAHYSIYENSYYNYSYALNIEDRNILYNTAFRRYHNELNYNYKQYKSHDGCELNQCNLNNKYPQNKKWNWAVSYGKDSNTTYYFMNYEGVKWCRILGGKLNTDVNVSINEDLFDTDYGCPVYNESDGKVYIKVCKNSGDKGSYFVIDSKCLYQDNWNGLSYTDEEFEYSDFLKNALDNEYNVKSEVVDGKIKITMPPSDLLPTCTLMQHEFNGRKYYFSDTVFKPYSRLSRDVVVAKVDINVARRIYDNVVDTDNEKEYDENTINNFKSGELITVYTDPLNDSGVNRTYSYENFLSYLYKNGYIVDINNGYIYRKFNYYLDTNNYLYIKCIVNIQMDKLEKITYRWVRVKVSREWDNDEGRKSIYYRLDENGDYVLDSAGNKILDYDIGNYIPELTFHNIYDSRRYLQDPIIKPNGNYTEDVIDEPNVLKITNSQFECLVKQQTLSDSGLIVNDYVPEKDLQTYDNSKLVGTKLKQPLINVVKFGINQEFLDYLDTRFLNNRVDDFENTFIYVCELLNDYIKNVLGLNVVLDFYYIHIFRSDIVRKIIQFFKPKRDRMLSLSSSIELPVVDKFLDPHSDEDYNSVYLNNNNPEDGDNYNPSEDSLINLRSRVRQELNEYVPFNDLVFLKKDSIDYDVYSYREVYPYDNINKPILEVFDKWDDLNNHEVVVSGKKIIPSYYLSNFTDTCNGFYYKVEDYYENGNFKFVKMFLEIVSKYNFDGVVDGKQYLHKLHRWFVLPVEYSVKDITTIIYVSDADCSDVPWLTVDGDIQKYCSIRSNCTSGDEFVYDVVTGEYFNGDFQYAENGYSRIKTNRRMLEPLFYFDMFPSDKFNGYYYMDPNKTRNGHNMYFNQYGKMLAFVDLSYIPDTYLDFSINEYATDNKKYWIACDYGQIADISDASYIAFCNDNDESIFEFKQGKNTGYTKRFYRLRPSMEKYNSDLLFINYVQGITVSELEENYPERIQTFKNKYKNPDSYADIISRRVSQNRLMEKYEPSSWIDFRFGYGLGDFYNKTNVSIVCNGTQQSLYRDRYCTDINGNELGAVYLRDIDVANFNTDGDIKCLVICARTRTPYTGTDEPSTLNDTIKLCSDINWHRYIISNNRIYRDGVSVNILDSIDINNVELSDVDVCEFGTFNYDLPEWYYKIISEYGVFRYRPEGSKRPGNTNPKAYESVFATDMPRTVYGRFMTGLPENVQGDRVSSVKYDNGKLLFKPYDGISLFNGYKWNADGYYSDDPKEVSMLWTNKINTRIYDRMVIPKYDESGHIVGALVDEQTGAYMLDREYHISNLSKKITKPTNRPERMSIYFLDGVEFSVPSNYRAGDQIPCWWVKDPKDYKTGSVQHRPLYIAIKQNLEECYPHIKHTEDCSQYFDQNMTFDGASNGNCNSYYNSEVDYNTMYANNVGGFVEYKCNSYRLVDGGFDLGNDIENINKVPVYNDGDTYCCPCGIDVVNTTTFYEPNQSQITDIMRDNLIFHYKLRLDCSDNRIPELASGTYIYNPTIIYKQKNDLEFCYTHLVLNQRDGKRLKYALKQDSYTWSSDPTQTVYDVKIQYNLVPMYFEDSGYYCWELREIKHILCDSENVNMDNIIHRQNTNIQCADSDGNVFFKYDYIITCESIAYSYITSDMVRNDYNKYEHQYRLDVCGKKLCVFDSTVYGQLVGCTEPEKLNQQILNTYGFRNYNTIELIPADKTKIHTPSKFYHNGNYFLYGQHLYVYTQYGWVGPFEIIKDAVLPEQLGELGGCDSCKWIIDSVYTGKECYLRVQDDVWVQVPFNCGLTNPDINHEIYKPYSNNNNGSVSAYINIPYTNKKMNSWYYCIDIPDILQRIKNIKSEYYNNKWAIETEATRVGTCTTIKDRLEVYPYYICEIDTDAVVVCETDNFEARKIENIDWLYKIFQMICFCLNIKYNASDRESLVQCLIMLSKRLNVKIGVITPQATDQHIIQCATLVLDKFIQRYNK